MRTLKAAIAAMFLSAVLMAGSTAHAEGPGIGVERPLLIGFDDVSGSGAAAFVWDADAWHVDVLLSMVNFEDDTLFLGLGGRFFFVVHSGESADFSVGGGLMTLHTNRDSPARDETDFLIEGAGKIRFFLTPNVALHTSLGLAIFLGDDTQDVVGLVGQMTGAMGVTYFFN